MVVGRGGGSLEDLWEFGRREQVAEVVEVLLQQRPIQFVFGKKLFFDVFRQFFALGQKSRRASDAPEKM
jgi:hypothetical protein